jgi:hypothetical protein
MLSACRCIIFHDWQLRKELDAIAMTTVATSFLLTGISVYVWLAGGMIKGTFISYWYTLTVLWIVPFT